MKKFFLTVLYIYFFYNSPVKFVKYNFIISFYSVPIEVANYQCNMNKKLQETLKFELGHYKKHILTQKQCRTLVF